MKFASILAVLLLISCADNNTEKELIIDFINNIWLNDDAKIEEAKKYVDFGSMPPQNSNRMLVYMKRADPNYSVELSKMKPYKILNHQELQAEKIALNFEYDDYAKVYHLISNDKTVITSYVVDDMQILSFSYNLIKNKTTPLTPAIWNRMEWND